MAIQVIIMGAAGRMGSTFVSLLKDSEEFTIVGAVERGDKMATLQGAGFPVSENLADLLAGKSKPVIIDFTAPEASLANARTASQFDACHVIGTTGFTEDHKKELAELAKKIPLFWSPNMSVGINTLLKILPEMTKALGEGYDIEVMEIHHNKKKDSPSGTALRLGECLVDARDWSLADTACYHREGIIGERPKKEIGMQTLRGGDVVGIHTVYFLGTGERIEVTHHAHSRDNFAQGALRAVRWLQAKQPGRLYTMLDVLS